MPNKITSAANVEANHLMNGSGERRKAMGPLTRLGGDSGENPLWNGQEISPLTFVSPFSYKLICHLNDKIVTKDMIKAMDPQLRVTKGLYMIKYYGKGDKKRRKGRPFCIGQDLIRMQVYVSGSRHWNRLCDEIPELGWIRRNSTFSDRMFTLAAMHPGMTFWFCVDWIAYWDKLASEPGADFGFAPGKEGGVENRPFGAWKCSASMYESEFKGKMSEMRELGDVLKEVQAIETSPTVQAEMLAATGEAGVTHEHYLKGRGGNHVAHDPETGRFISKKKAERMK